jgi:hypothetical protein
MPAAMHPKRPWRAALRLLAEPIPKEKKRLLAERWAALDPRWRFPIQGFGQQATGCGATIGLMPKCDFDCQGCYLGDEANGIPRFSRDEAFRQLAELRRYLGPKGNVQLTDGEVTLLPEDELIAIIRRAHELGLIPMLMTHGDSFRRKPELLTRLVREGGLREVSIHVDITQRGRRGWKGAAAAEEELMPLREEFADLIRRVRRETGIRLRAATTLTISRDNLAGVPAVVDWCFRNRDAFGLISFQPLARVGRTLDHLQGVDAGDLWLRIGEALHPYGFTWTERSPLQFGHPDCTRMEPLAVYQPRGKSPRVAAVVRAHNAEDATVVAGFFQHGLGGLAYRDDTLFERVCRTVGVLAKAPLFFVGEVRRWASARAAALDTSLAGLAWNLLSGRARLDSFVVVSHHFMGDEEVATAKGRERLAACVFRLAVGDEMVPMCQVNAAGVREAVYAQGTAAVMPTPRKVLLPILAPEPAAACAAEFARTA